MAGVRGRAQELFYRRRGVRELALLATWGRRRRDAPDLAHIAFLRDPDYGPVPRDEALALHALVRATRPETVVELGFLWGQSTFNFLTALDADARIYSFDVDPACEQRARERFGHDGRLVFRLRSQDAITPDDLDGRRADLVFLDASHDLALNQRTLDRLVGLMADDGLLVVHDTGAIPGHLVPPDHDARSLPERWTTDGSFEPWPDERAFVNWALAAHPELAQIHLHSRRTVRWGLTLLQRRAPLSRPAAA